jgi:hypothetical protein
MARYGPTRTLTFSVDVSEYYIDTQQDPFRPVISPTQKPLPTQNNTIETNIHDPRGIRTNKSSNQEIKTYALDRAATGIDILH